MGLFGLSKKKNKAVYTLPNDPLDRLTPDGELPFGWYTANKAFTSKLQTKYKTFLDAWLVSREKSDLKEYAALKSFVIYMNDVKNLCERKGECYIFWRDVLFDDEYLARQTDRLKQLENKLKK